MNEENKEPVIIKLHPEPAEYLEAETAFLRAVGLCITRWAFVDRQLFWMFRFGLGAATHRAAIVYYNQQTISRRVAQVDELLRSAFAERNWHSESEEWQRLRNRIDELVPTRNIVAHQPVRRVGKSDGKRAVYEYSIYVEPFQRYLGKTYKGLIGKDALETKDLVDHANQVEDLETELMAFARALVKKKCQKRHAMRRRRVTHAYSERTMGRAQRNPSSCCGNHREVMGFAALNPPYSELW